jgi:hypothetical protein
MLIQVREVFQIHPEHMKEAKAAAKELVVLEQIKGMGQSRLLTDLTGDYYTLVLEVECASLAGFEQALTQAVASPEWAALYGRLRPAIRGGRREIYQIVS